ncbi:MAG: imidazolonepropionase [Caldisericia bacterium]|nr:imidazolonepropionase [Caldisericia bacterium]MDD4614750.1 imidazolonepropionase [Caldisericia bacterium]
MCSKYSHSKRIWNISELVAPCSDNGNPLRGDRQNELLRIPHAYIAIQDGNILDFGPMSACPSEYESFPIFDVHNSLVMPGFVDPHTHLVFEGERAKEYVARLQGEDYLSILSAGGGILETVRAVRKASLEDLTRNTENRMRECLQYGTTAFEIKSGYGLTLQDEVKMLQAATVASHNIGVCISRTLLAAHAVPPEFEGNTDGYIRYMNQSIVPYVGEKKLAENIDVFCEEGVFSAVQAEEILKRGIQFGLRPKLHIDEFKSIGGLSLAAQVKAISADHMMVSNPLEFPAFCDAGGVAVVLPGTCFGLSHGRKDYNYAKRLIHANIPVAIGTDLNPGTCMCGSMQMMIEIAILQMGLTLSEAINAATVNASFASGLEFKTGAIEKGKRADLQVLSIQSLEEFPYRFGLNKVTRVLLKGIDFA